MAIVVKEKVCHGWWNFHYTYYWFSSWDLSGGNLSWLDDDVAWELILWTMLHWVYCNVKDWNYSFEMELACLCQWMGFAKL